MATQMRIRLRAPLKRAWSLAARSLSGRLLLVTLGYLLASEILIFLPAIGLYERELLDDHILSAELTIMPFAEMGAKRLPRELSEDLLQHTDADLVLLKRPYQRDFYQIGAMHSRIDRTIDLTSDTLISDIINGMECLIDGGSRTLQVVAPTRIKGAQSIAIILDETPIRAALIRYAERVVAAALFISGLTAGLIFVSMYGLVVRPMRRIALAMAEFHENPEDSSRILKASRRTDEIGVAERELESMQRDLSGFLRQKARLAALGAAVSRIQHDLRNILSNAQLASDRLSASDDPAVKRLAPRLMAAIDRAIALATTTLQYGRAEEAPPQRTKFALRALVEDAAQTALETGPSSIRFENRVDADIWADADREQLFRIVLNLIQNAAQACTAGGEIEAVAASHDRSIEIDISDSGPGVPESVRDKLFRPFVSAARPGGSGLGLAIARDLARGHGGELSLVSTGPQGTVFRILLPNQSPIATPSRLGSAAPA
jgi:signal transduction histidine kinase